MAGASFPFPYSLIIWANKGIRGMKFANPVLRGLCGIRGLSALIVNH
jgi:hypothetical protein